METLFGLVLISYSGIDECSVETRHNGQVETKVCSQTKGEQRVDVISEEQILGKFFRPTRERPSPGAETLLVTKTRPLVTAIACGNSYRL